MPSLGERLAGQGRLAAPVSAMAVAVVFVLQQVGGSLGSPGSLTGTVASIVFDAALWVWVIGYAVLAIDLDHRLGPREDVPGSAVGADAALVAAITPIFLFAAQWFGSFDGVSLAYLVLLCGVGASLVTLVRQGRNEPVLVAGGLGGLGIATGVAFLFAGVGFGSLSLPGAPLFTTGFYVLLGAEILYVAWAAFVGRRLRLASDGPEAATSDEM